MLHIYIYDISSLRVNDLTFILLTWRKWLARNNASRQQMGFNSGFKGLNTRLHFMKEFRETLQRAQGNIILPVCTLFVNQQPKILRTRVQSSSEITFSSMKIKVSDDMFLT